MNSDTKFIDAFSKEPPFFASRRKRLAGDSRIAARDMRVILYGLSLFLDCCALIAGFSTATLVREDEWLSAGGYSLLALALPIFLMFSIAREVQSVETLESRSLGISRALGALAATAIFVILLMFLMKAEAISRVGFAISFGASAAFIILDRILLDMIFWATMKGSATAKLLILDGVEAKPVPTMDVIDLGAHGLWPDLTRPEKIDALSHMVANYDRVVVACQEDHRRAWSTFLRGSDVGGEVIVNRNLLQGAVAIGQCGGADTLILSHGPLSLASRIQKRTFDLAVATPLTLFLAPLFIAVAIAIKLDSRGPVFFRQVRVGQGNRQFRILKFRSMRTEASDPNGSRSTGREDDRITRVGAFIRRTSIDELPQLLNVLRGDMSLVGPRPHALGSLAGQSLFWEVTDSYWLRHALKPGITGLAQIRGFRGSTDRPEDLTQRLRCDLEYLSSWSIWKDFLICLRTLRVVVHKNAY
ncbi:MAG: exopolysaccharide biosynthesis polyprenyl glycosylphosphotransferase [Novosphingobium sp.]